MRDDVREAIDSACSGDDRSTGGLRLVRPGRRISFDGLSSLLLRVLRDLPEDLTVQELREDLEGG